MGSICRTGIEQVLYYSTAAAGFLFSLSPVNLLPKNNLFTVNCLL